MDTGLAEHTMSSMNMENGAVVPPNLVYDRFTQFTADNIDINDGTLDGKNTVHATQMAAWQRGLAQDVLLNEITPSSKTISVPEARESLVTTCGLVEPVVKEVDIE